MATNWDDRWYIIDDNPSNAIAGKHPSGWVGFGVKIADDCYFIIGSCYMADYFTNLQQAAKIVALHNAALPAKEEAADA